MAHTPSLFDFIDNIETTDQGKFYDLLYTNAGGYTVVSDRNQYDQEKRDYVVLAYLKGKDGVQYFSDIPDPVKKEIEKANRDELAAGAEGVLAEEEVVTSENIIQMYETLSRQEKNKFASIIHPLMEQAIGDFNKGTGINLLSDKATSSPLVNITYDEAGRHIIEFSVLAKIYSLNEGIEDFISVLRDQKKAWSALKDEVALPSRKIEDAGEVIPGARKFKSGGLTHDAWSSLSADDKKMVALKKEMLWPAYNKQELKEQGYSAELAAYIIYVRNSLPNLNPRLKGRRVLDVVRGFTIAKYIKEREGTDIEPPQASDLYAPKNPLLTSDLYVEYVLGMKAAVDSIPHSSNTEDAADLLRGTFSSLGLFDDVSKNARRLKTTPLGNILISIKVFKDSTFDAIMNESTQKKGRWEGITWEDMLAKTARKTSESKESLVAKINKIEYLEDIVREGEDYRKGEDATESDFIEIFGIRGVQFGNYLNNKERQQVVNRAFDALMDLSVITGIPPHGIGLNGKLALAFGARGTGGKNPAAAHYEPDRVVINLTKHNGRGSLAHEWIHAVDNHLGNLKTENRVSAFFASELRHSPIEQASYVDKVIKEQSINRVREANYNLALFVGASCFDSVHDRYKRTVKSEISRGAGNEEIGGEKLSHLFGRTSALSLFVHTMNDLTDMARIAKRKKGWRRDSMVKRIKNTRKEVEATDFYENAIALDREAGKREPYFSKFTELTARSFEVMIKDRAAELGIRNDFLVSPSKGEGLYKTLGIASPYQSKEERELTRDLYMKSMDSIAKVVALGDRSMSISKIIEMSAKIKSSATPAAPSSSVRASSSGPSL